MLVITLMTSLYNKTIIKHPRQWLISIKILITRKISSILFCRIRNNSMIGWRKVIVMISQQITNNKELLKIRRVSRNNKTLTITWYKNMTNKALSGHHYKPATTHPLKEPSNNKNH